MESDVVAMNELDWSESEEEAEEKRGNGDSLSVVSFVSSLLSYRREGENENRPESGSNDKRR